EIHVIVKAAYGNEFAYVILGYEIVVDLVQGADKKLVFVEIVEFETSFKIFEAREEDVTTRMHGNAAEMPYDVPETSRKRETSGTSRNAWETSPKKVETFLQLGKKGGGKKSSAKKIREVKW
ncbi:hypothetical protein Tco_1498201, partial [Tanacetum coccineum]